MEVFSENHAVPFSKMLTYFRKEPFSMKAFYAGNIPYPDPYIGEYNIISDLYNKCITMYKHFFGYHALKLL
jgi:hypothetical protein